MRFYREDWTQLRRALEVLEVLSDGVSAPKSRIMRRCDTTAKYMDLDKLIERGFVSVEEIARGDWVKITNEGRQLLEYGRQLINEWVATRDEMGV